MDLKARFRCVAGCPGEHPLTSVIYSCPTCGGLLDVVHDLAALRARSPAQWRALLAERNPYAAPPHNSGVWSKAEWVQPHVELVNIVSLGEGATPLTPVAGLARALGLGRLWIKQCGISHTGSFKDLGMTVLVSSVKQMIREGQPIRALACASTGDTSAALSAYGAAAAVPVVVLLPRGKISAAQLVQPLAGGALVCSLDTDFDGCMRVVQALTRDPTIYLANSMNSLRVEGQKTIAAEILQQLGWRAPDWILIPGGNLGNVSALAKGLGELRELGLCDRLPRIVCCQAEAANPLYLAFERARAAGRRLSVDDHEAVRAAPTQASAIRIGAPVSLPRAVRALSATDGLVEQASEAELARASARADRLGMFTCPHTGVALACLEKLVARNEIEPGATVVVISTAHGLKFTEFKRGEHEAAPRECGAWDNRPVELSASSPEGLCVEIHRALDRVGAR